jgi:hypothetical protein
MQIQNSLYAKHKSRCEESMNGWVNMCKFKCKYIHVSTYTYHKVIQSHYVGHTTWPNCFDELMNTLCSSIRMCVCMCVYISIHIHFCAFSVTHCASTHYLSQPCSWSFATDRVREFFIWTRVWMFVSRHLHVWTNIMARKTRCILYI